MCKNIYLYSDTSHLMKNYFTISINSELRSLKIVLPVLINSFHNGFSIPQIPRGLSLSLSLSLSRFSFTVLLKILISISQ